MAEDECRMSKKKWFIIGAAGFVLIAMFGAMDEKTMVKDTRTSGCSPEWTHKELDVKLRDPSWRQHMMNEAERNHWDVRPPNEVAAEHEFIRQHPLGKPSFDTIYCSTTGKDIPADRVNELCP
jgi:hypothetical protein